MSGILIDILLQSWLVLGDMAPYLLAGFLVAGVLSLVISPEWTERHLGGRGWRPVLIASLVGVPLPLCSCGVIPVAASIRRHGASRAATAAFLLSTPQTGADSIAVTYALLGPVFAAFRPIAALISGLMGGLLVLFFGEDRNGAGDGDAPAACAEACCTGDRSQNALLRGLHYGLVVLPRDLAASLLVGVVIAGALNALVSRNLWQAYLGGGLVSILVMMALGIPIYVCATASVPIALGLIHAGASPGAALAFLIAGPATNAATIAVVWKMLGRRTTALYLLTVAVSAVVCGLLLDQLVALVQALAPRLAPQLPDTHVEGGWAAGAWAVALLVVLAYSCLSDRLRWRRNHDHEHPSPAGPSRACGHCG